MADVIYPEIETDPGELEEIAFDYLRSAWPGWEPTSELDGITQVIRSLARIIAEARDVAADVPAAILRWLGTSIFRVPPLAAAPAIVQATFTMRDSAGYTIRTGTEILVKTAGDDGVAFAVLAPVTVAPGRTATSAGEVTLRATGDYEGTIGNGLDDTFEAVVIQSFDFIESVELVGTSSGGVDAETDDEYADRLVDELEIQSPAPILPRDFAILARRIPGVARSLALNLYDPVTRTSDNERMVTVAVVGEDGLALPTEVKDAVQVLLESMRETNWRCPVIDPTYTAIDVAFEAIAWDDEDASVVEAAALAATDVYLSPATWGTRPTGEQPEWNDEPVVYWSEVNAMLNNVPGLKRVTRLQIGLEGRALGTADIPLTGPAALPRPGVGITGTVSAG